MVLHRSVAFFTRRICFQLATFPDNNWNAIGRRRFTVVTGVPLQTAALLKLSRAKMPFGKYAGWLLIDLPEPYVVWFARQGFPEGPLGDG